MPMNTRSRYRRTGLLTLMLLLLLAVMVGSIGLWLHAQQRRYALNRQLIAALVHDDTDQALALVNAGADPNTPYAPPPTPSLKQLWNQLLHRSASPANDSPTAFLIACGAYWPERVFFHVEGQKSRLDVPELAAAMLRHGANANAKDNNDFTALHSAVTTDRPNIAAVLLQYGANVNARDKTRTTPLLYATLDPDTLRLLLDHGADANAQDDRGMTPLYWEVYWSTKHVKIAKARACILLLLAHGADPNLPIKGGYTPLKLAQYFKRPDLVPLLKQSGAKSQGNRP